jgi:hypothetical protein
MPTKPFPQNLKAVSPRFHRIINLPHAFLPSTTNLPLANFSRSSWARLFSTAPPHAMVKKPL